MEKKYIISGGKHIVKILTVIFAFLLLCVACALTGYYFARARNPVKMNTHENGALNEYNLPQESHAPFHLPTLHVENDVTVSPSPLPASEIIEYLVIAENDVVRLYRLMQNGEKTFQNNLDISLSALTEEDRLAFIEGRILKSEDELSSLLEDYTS